MTDRLRDCPFCGSQIGYSDRVCGGCGETDMPTPEAVERAYAIRWISPNIAPELLQLIARLHARAIMVPLGTEP